MFLLPVVVTFIVLLIMMLFIASDYRVYSRVLRLDLLGLFAAMGIVASGIISLILYIGGLR